MNWIIFLILLIPSLAFSAPAVTGTTGTLTHGTSVTISGSGFGSKASAAPVAFGDMENNSVNARIGAWTQTGYPDGIITVSGSNARHANSSYNATCTFANQNEFCAFQGAPASASIYAQYWVYLDSGFDWGLANIKLFRLWATSGAENLRVQSYNRGDVVVEGPDEGHGGYYSGACPPSPSGGWYPVVPGGSTADAVWGHSSNCSDWLPGSIEWRSLQTDISKSAWHLFQFEFQEGSANTANGTLRWWVDGKKVFDHSDVTTRTGAYNKFVQVLGFYRDSTNDGTGTLHLDDLYIDNTWSRVEIGDASTYATSTHREIQPATSWEDGSVAVTLNRGSFGASDNAYLYVVDSTGAVNSSGYAITFGDQGAADTTPAAFTFTDNSSVALSTVIYSTSIQATAIDNDTSIAISGTGCEYQVNGAGSWLTSGDNVVLNDNVALRVTSSGSYSTDTPCVLTLNGNVSDTWHVTTLAAVSDPVAPRFRGASMSGGWR